MEHGQIVKFNKLISDYNSHHIAVKYGGYYLFLSTNDLNRREDFITEDELKDRIYKETEYNINNLPIVDLIKQHIEIMDSKEEPYKFYTSGSILKGKTTDKLYSQIVVSHDNDRFLYTIDLETFQLNYIGPYGPNITEEMKKNYTQYTNVNFNALKLKIK